MVSLFEHPTFSCINILTIRKPSYYSSHLPAYEDGTDSVPKRRHTKFRRRGITQKKTYNIIWTRLNPRPLDLLTVVADDIGLFDNVLPPPDAMGS
jgi:hypothetical protein